MDRDHIWAAGSSLTIFLMSGLFDIASEQGSAEIAIAVAHGLILGGATYPAVLWSRRNQQELFDTISDISLQLRILSLIGVVVTIVGGQSLADALVVSDDGFQQALGWVVAALVVFVPLAAGWALYRAVIRRRVRLQNQ